MIVGYGIAAWPFLAAKYELHERRRALTALMIGVAAILAALLISGGARAATLARPSDARSGSLILKAEGEGYTDAARLGIDVDVTVSGPTLRARVTQVFRNTTNDWVEAIYVYPLPDGGAVDTLKMVIGDRVVVGDFKERQQARVIYEQAKQNGQKAALTEQERPNIFTNSVANIGPGETVLVQIEYQQRGQYASEQGRTTQGLLTPNLSPLLIVMGVLSRRCHTHQYLQYLLLRSPWCYPERFLNAAVDGQKSRGDPARTRSRRDPGRLRSGALPCCPASHRFEVLGGSISLCWEDAQAHSRKISGLWSERRKRRGG